MGQRQKREKNRGSSGNNRKMSEEFLEKNKNKDGVVETESGLQYLIIEQGEGDFPKEDSFVKVHQRCQLLNGNVIEDTYKENKPSEVHMLELIEGYREGLLLMNKGARFKFFISSALAWGRKGTGTKIPPNSLLIFDVRLVDFW